MRRALSLLVIACCMPGLLKADGLSDLITRLKGMDTRESVRLKIDQDSTETEDGKDLHEQRSLVIEDGPAGLRVSEDSRVDAAKKTRHGSMSLAGKSMSETPWRRQAQAHLDLLEELDRARLIEDRMDVLDGQPVRCLKVNLDLGLDADAQKVVKQASHVATLWLGKDGFPVAMKRDLYLKVRAMVFVKVWTRVDSWYRFSQVGHRLITTEARERVQGEAMGHGFSANELTRCVALIRPPAAPDSPR